jgi:sugar lactone lactonase YvrE
MPRWPLILLSLALMTCAPGESGLDSQAVMYETIVWPQPPQPPRVRLVGIIGSPDDLGIRPSIFGRLWSWIAGAEPRAMVRPYAITSAGNRLAVADPGAGVVHLYDLARRDYERIDWAEDRALRSPVGVAMRGDALYVTDSGRASIFVFGVNGKLIRTLKGPRRPTGLVWDEQGDRFFVTDTMSHNIVVLDPDGKQLFAFGRRGTGEGEFNFPSHLSLSDVPNPGFRSAGQLP